MGVFFYRYYCTGCAFSNNRIVCFVMFSDSGIRERL